MGPLRRLIRDVKIIASGIPEDGIGPGDPRLERLARSITRLYLVMAGLMALWIVYLAVALPQRNLSLHYDVTWVVFDCFLVVSMGATAWYAHRRDPAVERPATATATLLLVDAWMDISTSSSTHALITAIAFAMLLELPIALLSLRLATNVQRSVARRAQLAGEPRP
jgi:hypothetical protein